jgi:hypothetical protein
MKARFVRLEPVEKPEAPLASRFCEVCDRHDYDDYIAGLEAVYWSDNDDGGISVCDKCKQERE